MSTKIRLLNSKYKKKTTSSYLTALLASTLSCATTAQAGGTYVSQFSTKVAADNKSTHVTDVTILSNGNVAVADALNQKIKIFNKHGILQNSFGSFGRGQGQFKGLSGLTEGPNNTLFAANRDNKRIDIFNFDGTYLSTINTGNNLGSPNSKPTGIAIDKNTSKTFVADQYNNCIQVFDRNGTYLTSFGGTNRNKEVLDRPLRVFVDSDAQIVYVSNAGNHKVSLFQTDGTFLRHFNQEGDTTTLKHPSTLSKVNDKLYVADQANHRIQAFNANGASLTSLGSYGSEPGKFNVITSFSIQENTGSVFVADATNHRIQKFFDPQVWTKPGEVTFAQGLNIPESLDIKKNQKITVVSGEFSIEGDLSLDEAAEMKRHSGGSITTDGDLNFAHSSSYHFVYDASNTTGSLTVNGTAHLNGTAIMSNLQDLEFDTPQVILTADEAIDGQFSRIKTTSPIKSPFIKPQLSYDDTHVYVTLKWLKFAEVAGDKKSSIHHVLDQHYDAITPDNSLRKVINAIETLPTPQDVTKALEKLSPRQSQQITAVASGNTSIISNAIRAQTVSHRTTRTLNRNFTNFNNVAPETAQRFSSLVQNGQQGITQFVKRLIQSSSHNTKNQNPDFNAIDVKQNLPQDMRAQLGQSSIWIQQNGQFFRQKPTEKASGLRSTTIGMSIGADYQLNNEILVGLASGFAGNDYTLMNREGSGDVNSAFLGVYGSWNAPGPGWFVDAAAFIGRHRFSGERLIEVGSNSLTAKQKHKGQEFATNLMIGYDIALDDNYTVQPHVETAFQYLRENDFKETGAPGANLAVAKHQSRFLRTGIGFELAKLFVNNERIFRPTIKIGIAQRRELGNSNRTRAEFTALPGSSFTVVADKDKQNLITFGTGLTAMFAKDVYVSASYNGEYNKKTQSHEALLRFGWVL